MRRLALGLLVVWGAVSIIFLIVRIVPGDPASLMLGPSASPEQIAALRERLGLDAPLLEQYVAYLGNALRLDFGDSLRQGIPASQAVASRLGPTVTLAATALVITLVVGLPLGILAARWNGSFADRSVRVLSLAAQSLPAFWVGLILLLVFARQLKVLPSIGAASPTHYLLPSITLALPLIGTIVLLVRGGLLDVFDEPYLQTARSKGVGDRAVVVRHALPNTLIPVVTVVGLMVADLLGGLVIVETVFAWPGMGRLTVDAIHDRDYPVVQACVAFIAIVYVITNLGVDLLYGRLDPRVRTATA
jgi:peptide/nickel transport system permease protein